MVRDCRPRFLIACTQLLALAVSLSSRLISRFVPASTSSASSSVQILGSRARIWARVSFLRVYFVPPAVKVAS